MRVAVIGTPTRTSDLLVEGWLRLGLDACIVWPREALDLLLPGDVALARLDVLPTLDGVEPGLGSVARLARRGVRVLNRPSCLLAAHDKLFTQELLQAAGLPHPRTAHAVPGRPLPDVPVPCVVKPRFGSWGRDCTLCRTRAELEATLTEAELRPWWSRHGALVQELVEPRGHDLRVLVAGGRVVGTAARISPPGEWRTNVSLGAELVRADAPAEARRLALQAAAAIRADLVSVDLLPLDGGHVVLEVNGAADFDERYVRPGVDLWAGIAVALGLTECADTGSAAAPMPSAPWRETIEAITRREAAMRKTMLGEPVLVGDEITITGHAVGDAPRRAIVLEVLGRAGHEHFRVRWEDGHESIFFPGDDAVIRRPDTVPAA